jgi:hypothetical protein
MPVTISVEDLIQPDGELADSYFPDNDLGLHVEGWLTQSILRIEGNPDIVPNLQDEAARSYAYYLAYSHIAKRLGSMPNSVSMNSGADSVSIAQDRPAYWQALADEEYDVYAATIRPVMVDSTPRESFTIPTRAAW